MTKPINRGKIRLDKAKENSSDAPLDVALFAKWAVPSITGLFVVIGYIVRTAHVSLLGVDFRDIVPENYFGSAADFFIALLNEVAKIFTGNGGAPLELGGHGIHLFLGIVLVVLACCLRFLKHPFQARTSALVGLALLLAVAGKFALFDAPIAAIENVTASGRFTQSVSKAATSQANIDPSSGLASNARLSPIPFIAERSEKVWSEMWCRRLNPANPSASNFGMSPRANELWSACESKKLGMNKLNGEFVANMVATVVILLLAWLALGTDSVFVKSVAVLAVFYSLSLPYAYGKLVKSTDFQYGRIELNQALLDRMHSKDPAKEMTVELRAIVLGHSQGGLNFLIARQEDCARAVGAEQARFTVAKIWTVSSSQVLSIREIYREDVIRWKALHESSCPPAALPPPPR